MISARIIWILHSYLYLSRESLRITENYISYYAIRGIERRRKAQQKECLQNNNNKWKAIVH